MKVKKLISKGLALGFVLNSFSTLSYANTEIPNRYQTLEGEYITIDDSTAGNLKEIEIFGNTVQDSNNLENIQSVGDLYVDDEGNPILDSQGREQYKINITSMENRTIKTYDYFINTEAYFLQKDSNSTSFYIDNIKAGVEYKFNVIKPGGNRLIVATYDSLKTGANPVEILYKGSNLDVSVTPNIDANYMVLYRNSTKNENIEIEILSQLDKFHKITILSPYQLQKIGNIKDRLYWDNGRNRYLIEKNISEKVYDGSDDELIVMHVQASLSFNCGKIDDTTYSGSIISNRAPSYSFIDVSNTSVYMNKGWLIYTQNDCGALVSDANYKKVNTLREYLKVNPLTIYYPLDSSKLIETNIIEPIKIQTYETKTHIYINSENGIRPTLKVTVDRIEQVSQEAVNIAISTPTTYNISLARMFVNQLSESLYKDQLQEQLNNIFSNEVVLEKKNATANLDLYIKSENILQMSLNTNSITFEDFSGVEDMTKENAVNISINSSLPYSLNAYLPNEIQNSDKSNTMDKTILNIKENSETTYQTFTNLNEKIVLKDNNPAGNNINHGIDIKLKGNIAHQKDVYKTTIKFEAEQK